jgi:hypothetical protein
MRIRPSGLALTAEAPLRMLGGCRQNFRKSGPVGLVGGDLHGYSRLII